MAFWKEFLAKGNTSKMLPVRNSMLAKEHILVILPIASNYFELCILYLCHFRSSQTQFKINTLLDTTASSVNRQHFQGIENPGFE